MVGTVADPFHTGTYLRAIQAGPFCHVCDTVRFLPGFDQRFHIPGQGIDETGDFPEGLHIRLA